MTSDSTADGSVRLPPPRDGGGTALLLIDLQNAFLHPDGEHYYPAAAQSLAPQRELLDAARRAGRLIIHTAQLHRPGLRDFEQIKLPEHCRIGEWNAEFFEGFGPGERAGEVVIAKRRPSAFFRTDLDLLLNEQGITRLVIAGVKTNVCVRATVTDGFSHGFECLVVREATSSNRLNLADASLEDIQRYFGWAVSLPQALESLQ